MTHIPDEPSDGFLSEVIPYHYSTAIGEVVSKWALLEHEIDAAIWDFAGLFDTPKIGACLTGQYSSVAAKFNALLALVHLREVPELQIAKLNRFKGRVFDLAEKRNRVAHDPWLANWDLKATPINVDKTYRLHKTARGKLEYVLKPTTLDELKMLSDEIAKAINDFRDLALTPALAPYEVR